MLHSPPAPTDRAPGRSLADRFDPRDNSLGFLRLALAATVVVVHSQGISTKDWPDVGQASMGDLAVDGFFVVSGFLVTRSATSLPTLRRFAWHRMLRILPAFWLALAVTAFVAAPLLAVLQGLPVTRAFTGPDPAHHFVLKNSLLYPLQWNIGGLRIGPEGHEHAMNGSLWTLFYEAACYAMAGGLVAVGVIRRRRVGSHRSRPNHLLFLTGVVLVWVAYTGEALGVLPAGPEFVVRFTLMFLLGATGHLFAHRITFAPYFVVPAVAALLWAVLFPEDWRPVGAVPYAYLLLWATVALPLRWLSDTDLSYGLYVFHWPVISLLIAAGATRFGGVGLTVLALLIAGTLATLSWHFVEKPMLRFKSARWIDGAAPRPAAGPATAGRAG